MGAEAATVDNKSTDTDKDPLADFNNLDLDDMLSDDGPQNNTNQDDSKDDNDDSKSDDNDANDDNQSEGDADGDGNDDSSDDNDTDGDGETDTEEENNDNQEEDEGNKDDDDKQPEDKDDDSIDFELKIPEGDDNKKAETWKDIGEELGLKTEGDDFNHLKEAYNKKLEEIKTSTAIDKDAAIKEYSPEAQEVIKFIENGGKIEDYVNPVAQIDQFLAMDSETLLRTDLQAKNRTEEQINKQIDKWTENDEIEDKALDLKDELKVARENTIKKINESQENYQREQQEAEERQEQANNELFEKELTGRQDFLGVKLNDKHRTHIMNLWESGKATEKLNDVAGVVDYLMYKEFGDQLFGEMKKRAFQNGTDKVKKDLHNIKPSSEEGSRVDPSKNDQREGFDTWADIETDAEITVER